MKKHREQKDAEIRNRYIGKQHGCVLAQVLNGCGDNRESHVLLTRNTAALENLWC